MTDENDFQMAVGRKIIQAVSKLSNPLKQNLESVVYAYHSQLKPWLVKPINRGANKHPRFNVAFTMMLLVCCESEKVSTDHVKLCADGDDGTESYLLSLLNMLEVKQQVKDGVPNHRYTVAADYYNQRLFDNLCFLFFVVDPSLYVEETNIISSIKNELQFSINNVALAFLRIIKSTKFLVVSQDKADPFTNLYKLLLPGDEGESLLRTMSVVYDFRALNRFDLPVLKSDFNDLFVGGLYGTNKTPSEVGDWVIVMPGTVIPEGTIKVAVEGTVTSVLGINTCNVHLDDPYSFGDSEESIQDCLGVSLSSLRVLFRDDLPDAQLKKYCQFLITPHGIEKGTSRNAWV